MSKRKISKKWWLSLMGLLLVVAIGTISYSISVEGKTNVPKKYIIHSIKEDNTQSVNLATDKNMSAVFEVTPSNNDNQNAFYIHVSDTSSKYKIIITATNGYKYESKELTRDVILPSTNIDPDVTYNIFIISTSATPFSATINITSNIEK